ncbi:MAG TPA: hypothetical protein DCG19_04880 [Cryomorphaceae bacterium]|nr:hypothetical protein [Owenweeksia sp.]MBF99272.1 hypothetical protein [Owenweeksia sp.]HAD96717.1 hypothetical protein [Cryomorphaceae bacterium]HBF21428.1 hypothetical protein [Cryomorphaceae bacterium]|tara:strand:+ start:12684 stop:13613 length:930 start_codon:yes stop_codon:yes gene_type:complete
MRRLTLHILFFLLPPLLVLYFFPVSEKAIFAGIENDCAGRGKWVYQRLYHSKTPVDMAMLGSSKTIHSVNSERLEPYLSGWHVANFGYCRYGRNLQLSLLKRILSEKKPKVVIMEVRAEENPYSHPVYPYIATNGELLTNYPLFNKDWLSDEFTAAQYRLQLIQELLLQPDSSTTFSDSDKQEHSFQPLMEKASRDDLRNMKEKRQKGDQRSSWKKKLDNTFPWHYLQQMAKLCEEEGVTLFFLYLPNYGVPLRQPVNIERYREYGPVLLPPQAILDEPENWADPNHLNYKGAELLTDWLGEELSTRVK